MAHAMAGAGPGDVFASWLTEIRNTTVSSTTLLNLITGAFAGMLSAALLLVAMVVYPVAYTIFAVLYSLFGAILYVVGPLVLALMPSMGLGNLARRYAASAPRLKFAVWDLLPISDGIEHKQHGCDHRCRQLRRRVDRCNCRGTACRGEYPVFVCILLIPFLAKRIVEGDLGSAMFAVLASAATLAQSAVAFAAGPGDGFGRVSAAAGSSEGGSSAAAAGSAGVPPPAPAAPTAGGAAVAPSSVASSGSQAPSGPRTSGGRGMGDWRTVNIPHSVGWLAGAAAAIGVQGGQRVLSAGRSLIAQATGAGGASSESK